MHHTLCEVITKFWRELPTNSRQNKFLFLSHHLADFLAEHTLDFILHRLGAGFAEMRPDQIGGLTDFLHHRGWGVRLGSGVSANDKMKENAEEKM